jgi:NADH-quinone oxidoreductase subunit E
MMVENKSILSAEICGRIDQWILRYPPEQRQSGVFEALRLVQEKHGLLTTALMNAVADYLGMSRIAVYEVATFYTMYYLKPMGQHVIDVCTNISCSLNGAQQILEYFKKRLGITVDETTSDGRFTLKEVECLGACIRAPVCQIGKHYYESLTPDKIDDILTTLGLADGK